MIYYLPHLIKSDRYIISDTHLGHSNISNFRPLGNSSEEQHEGIMECLSLVPKRATLFLLGDIAFDKYWLDRIKALPCRNKILIVGNHDLDRGNVTMKDLVETYEQVYALHKYKKHWMSHAPIHPMELRGKRSVHGHTHYQLMVDSEGNQDTRYANVCAEYVGHKPVPWEYAISEEYQQECKRKWEYYKNEKRLDDKALQEEH